MLNTGRRFLAIATILLVALQLLPAAQLAKSPPIAAARATQATPEKSAAGAGDTDPELYDAILPEHRDRIYAKTAGRLSRYRIAATLSPDLGPGPATFSGTVALRYVNESASPEDAVFFRLYPNAPAYGEAAMSVSDVRANGNPAMTTLSVDDTVLEVRLSELVAPMQAVDIELDFSATVPVRPTSTYGIFAVNPEDGTIALAHGFPILAGRDENGWSLDPVSRNGDPIFSNTALFDVTITVPPDWKVAATGTEIESHIAKDGSGRRFVSGPARDFTLVTNPRFELMTGDVEGTTVQSYFLPEDAAGGEAVLTYGSRALAIFNELLVPYPYRHMTLVETELFGAGGVEFPQLMMMGSNLYGDNNPRNEHYLEFVTAHEVGHQWFFGLVGNNQHRDAFIDEGLDEYLSSEVYFSAQYGAETGRRQYGLEVLMWYLGSLDSRGDAVVDQATDDFSSTASYGAAVYAKAAIGFAQIHELIGDEAFFAALQHYCREFEFGLGTPAALLAAFEAASDDDVAAVWRYWFEGEHGADFFPDNAYEELQVELGLR